MTEDPKLTGKESRSKSVQALPRMLHEDSRADGHALAGEEFSPNGRRAFAALLEESEVLRKALARAQAHIAELEHLVETDTLTPVANRRGIMRELSRAIAQVERYGIDAAILFVDVNGLKDINDRYGHVAGDAALQHVAQTIASQLRAADAVGRLGGDEFIVVLLHSTEAQALVKCMHLAAAVAATPVVCGDKSFHVSISAGAYPIRVGESPTSLLDQADKLMYEAKRRKVDTSFA